MSDLPLDPLLPMDKICRACSGHHIAYLRHVPMLQMSVQTPLYICLECDTMMHPQIYKESDDKLKRDAEWHISVEGRNSAWASKFWDSIDSGNTPIASVVEIGCGTGTFLSIAKQRGKRVHGYDTNPYVSKIAEIRHDIFVDPLYWTEGTCTQQFDLVVCIMVLEHLTDPAVLMNEIGRYCKRTGAASFVSVPFNAERHHWDDYKVEKPAAGNPLHLCDVHINHFSRKGFEVMVKNAGAKTVARFDFGWMGYLLSF